MAPEPSAGVWAAITNEFNPWPTIKLCSPCQLRHIACLLEVILRDPMRISTYARIVKLFFYGNVSSSYVCNGNTAMPWWPHIFFSHPLSSSTGAALRTPEEGVARLRELERGGTRIQNARKSINLCEEERVKHPQLSQSGVLALKWDIQFPLRDNHPLPAFSAKRARVGRVLLMPRPDLPRSAEIVSEVRGEVGVETMRLDFCSYWTDAVKITQCRICPPMNRTRIHTGGIGGLPLHPSPWPKRLSRMPERIDILAILK